MNAKYIGDIGDFGKYLLLAYVARSQKFDNSGKETTDFDLGVNWYLTGNDSAPGGKLIGYLNDPEWRSENCMKPNCEELYLKLKGVVDNPSRAIHSIETGGMLPRNTIFFGKEVPLKNRREWFKDSCGVIGKCDLLFLDPDNGLTDRMSGDGIHKYVTLFELNLYYHNLNADIVVYHHATRYKGGLEIFAKEVIGEWLRWIHPEIKFRVLQYRKGIARLYILIDKLGNGLLDKKIDGFLGDINTGLFKELITEG